MKKFVNKLRMDLSTAEISGSSKSLDYFGRNVWQIDQFISKVYLILQTTLKLH